MADIPFHIQGDELEIILILQGLFFVDDSHSASYSIDQAPEREFFFKEMRCVTSKGHAS